jgi:hypothetical protein
MFLNAPAACHGLPTKTSETNDVIRLQALGLSPDDTLTTEMLERALKDAVRRRAPFLLNYHSASMSDSRALSVFACRRRTLVCEQLDGECRRPWPTMQQHREHPGHSFAQLAVCLACTCTRGKIHLCF